MLKIAEKDTPYIHLSDTGCNFEIKGNSYSVLIDDIYNEVTLWINDYFPGIDCEINWKFHFEMISSASLKGIIKVIETLDNFFNQGKNIKITWITEGNDTDIIEIGEDISELTSVPFDFVQRY
ncbi:MAG: SiaC family regulatory phosphoprotein [Bacteroidales bacterium]|nr:SiaC family regulatory phosphoprotein [Bacteroidales bacterium]